MSSGHLAVLCSTVSMQSRYRVSLSFKLFATDILDTASCVGERCETMELSLSDADMLHVNRIYNTPSV